MEAMRGTTAGDGAGLRVAMVHYWLLNYGGGERVLSALLDLFPQADVFVLLANERTIARFATQRDHILFTAIARELPLSPPPAAAMPVRTGAI